MTRLGPDYAPIATSMAVYTVAITLWLLMVVPAWFAGTVHVHPRLVVGLGWPVAMATFAGGWILLLCRLGEGRLRPWLAEITRYIGLVCLAFASLRLVPLLGLVGSAVLTPYTLGTADAWLAAPEQWIGVTHRVAWEWAEARGLHPALEAVYHAMRWQVLAAFAYWVFIGRDLRPVWEMVALLGLTFAIGCGIYVLLPASGPYVFYGYGAEVPPPSFLADFEAMRSGEPFLLLRPDGYIAFPSFHTVWVVLTTSVWRRTPFVWIAVLWNVAVLAATFVSGWHYLTDLVAGGVLAMACIAWITRGAGSPSA